MDQKPSPTRGRPKLLDREQVLQTALIEYWAKGPTNVSIGEICKQTGASKPGVYREFGSDDGLKSNVLEAYRSFVIQPLIDIIVKDQPAARNHRCHNRVHDTGSHRAWHSRRMPVRHDAGAI